MSITARVINIIRVNIIIYSPNENSFFIFLFINKFFVFQKFKGILFPNSRKNIKFYEYCLVHITTFLQFKYYFTLFSPHFTTDSISFTKFSLLHKNTNGQEYSYVICDSRPSSKEGSSLFLNLFLSNSESLNCRQIYT